MVISKEDYLLEVKRKTLAAMVMVVTAVVFTVVVFFYLRDKGSIFFSLACLLLALSV
jgi:hypothetical protein